MLFSREDVAAYITRNFEPTWEMVRPVPMVRIDFGNGNIATRTLHGNVASYVCAADGQVLDILPGIYTPAIYTTSLEAPRVLSDSLSRLEPEHRQARLRQYHRERAQRLRNQAAQNVPVRAPAVQPGPGGQGQGNRIQDVGKGRIEMRVERIVVPAFAVNNGAYAPPGPRPTSASELANWGPLAVDTWRNENERRLLIHERFASTDPVRPEQIKRWLYRDVLHADLDDPYLGLGEDFFAELER